MTVASGRRCSASGPPLAALRRTRVSGSSGKGRGRTGPEAVCGVDAGATVEVAGAAETVGATVTSLLPSGETAWLKVGVPFGGAAKLDRTACVLVLLIEEAGGIEPDTDKRAGNIRAIMSRPANLPKRFDGNKLLQNKKRRRATRQSLFILAEFFKIFRQIQAFVKVSLRFCPGRA